ncbi:MAG TPA: metal ABC transporter substrate-binding protein [Nocardioides sp.]|jgi:zinc transport system substrate-binding protein|nr:metal ABC transporter substrate-binding protein [Nocardioides sp.]
MKRWMVAAVTLGLVATLATGCRGPRSGDHTVVASFYPLYFIAERVAGRYNDVIDLTPPGVEPHEYELTVRQVAEIDLARVGFYEHGVAPSIDQAMANDSPAHALDVASVVDLAGPVTGSGVESTSDDKDPHFWQDPTLMAEATRAFADTMAGADPAHASYYRNQGARLVHDLNRLDAAYSRTLASCRIRTVVVSHDAFEYLARRYQVDVVPIAGLEPDAEPSLQRLHDLSNLIRDRGVTTVFFETLASPDLARSLAGDVGIESAVLDPIEGLTSTDPHATYLTLMRQNLAALAKAGECT